VEFPRIFSRLAATAFTDNPGFETRTGVAGGRRGGQLRHGHQRDAACAGRRIAESRLGRSGTEADGHPLPGLDGVMATDAEPDTQLPHSLSRRRPIDQRSR
jgi:hypothetical protein